MFGYFEACLESQRVQDDGWFGNSQLGATLVEPFGRFRAQIVGIHTDFITRV